MNFITIVVGAIPRVFRRRDRSWLPAIAAVLLLGSLSALAYPPAPPTTLYGVVRGEFGFNLDDGETDLVLLADNVEVVRTTIRDAGRFNENYRLVLPLDLNPGVGAYRPGTVSEDEAVEYVIVAERGGTRIPVVEVNAAVDTFVPDAASLLRLDFTLGEDIDGDGLPDVWERFQVTSGGGGAAGQDPLALLSREGDWDGDGLTDWQEYIAGTFALLFEDELRFRIVDVADSGQTSVEFLAVDGKSYIIEASVDGKNWTQVEMETSGGTPESLSFFRAEDTQVESMEVSHDPSVVRMFYRLRVN